MKHPGGEARLIDTFRRSPIPSRRPVQISSADVKGLPWVLEPSDAGAYVIRIQPEYGAAGTYQLVFAVEPSFVCPVPGHGMRDVGSLFGDPRNGGQRRHNGVDIFAPRGTPVTAATDGVILAVDDTRIGGRVIWLRASDGRYAVYYAHLDRHFVQEGQQVCVGGTLGLVGNTGNTRTTPPHLHLGIYRRGEGAVDPWYFIAPVEPDGSSASHSTGTSR